MGELAAAMGVTDWPKGAATSVAKVCFGAWLKYRGHTGAAEIEAGIEQVRRFFILHGASRFTAGVSAEVDAGGRTVLNRVGFKIGGA